MVPEPGDSPYESSVSDLRAEQRHGELAFATL
jgi:hypothetical protein